MINSTWLHLPARLRPPGSGGGGGGSGSDPSSQPPTPPSYNQAISAATSSFPPPPAPGGDGGASPGGDADLRRAKEFSRIEKQLADARRREEDDQKIELAKRLSEKAELDRRDRAEMERAEALREKVARKLELRARAFRQGGVDLLREEHRNRARLERSGDDIEEELANLRKRREEIREHARQVEEATEHVRAFLSENEGRRIEVAVDDMCQPADVRSAQMLRLAAEVASISDALYFLDRALVRGTIGLDAHLKAVRRQAKKQFMAKALLMKIGRVVESERGDRFY
jgi:ESCRT-I complex subunit TSG101